MCTSGSLFDKESFVALVTDVGHWSEYNFGDQKGLNQLAPLLGMLEELGEYFNCPPINNSDFVEDAITPALDAKCDLFIYYCDYLYRSGEPFYEHLDFSAPSATNSSEEQLLLTLFSTLASLCHIELKRIQGIRKFTDEEFYLNNKKNVIYIFHKTLLAFVYPYDKFRSALEYVWGNVVSKRDWRKNSTDGK